MAKPTFEVVEGPEADRIIREMAAFARSSNYLNANRDHLLELYPEQWVAVLGEKVIAHDESYEVMLKRLLAIEGHHDAEVEFLTRNPPVLVLFGS